MGVVSINYDLSKPGTDYDGLIARIKALSGVWCRPTLSQWLVSTPLGAKEVRDALKPYIDGNDALFVATLTGEAAWTGLGPKADEWLMNQLGGRAARHY